MSNSVPQQAHHIIPEGVFGCTLWYNDFRAC